MILSGEVLVNGLVANKPARRVLPSDDIALVNRQEPRWVGRGALKLLGALDHFLVDPSGMVAADLGASTGGFTQVLLHRGARRVYAVDVGRAQLAWSLRTDPRVVVMERTNARHHISLDEPMELVVGDLSFISLRRVLPTVSTLLRSGGLAIVLVKPQFEVGRDAVESGGKVRDEEARNSAIEAVRSAAEQTGLTVLDGCDSVVPGARAGNIEHFLLLRRIADAQVRSDEPLTDTTR